MTLLRTKGLILLVAVSACLLGSCSAKDPGTPSAESGAPTGTSGSTASSAPSTSTGGAELPISTFTDKPCELLKADQVAQLGTFKAPAKSTNSVASLCKWGAQDILKGLSYTISVATTGTDFKTSAEQAKANNPYFKETKVGEYPAYNSDGTDAKGSCTTGVGTPSKGVFLAQVIMENEALPEYEDPCAATEKVAALVIQNLKG